MSTGVAPRTSTRSPCPLVFTNRYCYSLVALSLSSLSLGLFLSVTVSLSLSLSLSARVIACVRACVCVFGEEGWRVRARFRTHRTTWCICSLSWLTSSLVGSSSLASLPLPFYLALGKKEGRNTINKTAVINIIGYSRLLFPRPAVLLTEVGT